MKPRHLSPVLCCVLISLAAGAGAVTAEHPSRVTCDMLLREMIDMERLSTVPHPGVECDQQSSYDRKSVTPGNEDWFANGDRGRFIREEKHDGRTEYVMAEMEGPGAILRLWSANPQDGGTIRIYIDDLDRPALEADFLALTSSQMPEFPDPFSGIRARGANLYFPMPYQERCKVTVDIGKLYYHVGYRTFPKGTEVEAFSMELMPRLRSTMGEVGRILAQPAERFTLAGAQRDATEAMLGPGIEVVLSELDGPAAIVRMELEVDVPTEQLFAALREPVLTIRFDDEKEPCVWAPLGDFFGSTPGINPHESLPVGMKDGGRNRPRGTFYCNWYMPFGKAARVAVRNSSDDPIKLRFALWAKPAPWEAGTDLYFHAKWRNEWLPAEPRFLDWRMLEATGPGRFVGVMLGVMNTKQQWWGEGDEKVWVDDDAFPSFFGTGSEDYFGYAWCNTALFNHAYHNQSIVTGPGNFGYSAVARYHILDDIPFDKQIKFDIEKWASADREYCCTSYWYAPPGATDFFTPIPVEQRRVPPLPEPFLAKGALEGEKLGIGRCTGGTTQRQQVSGDFSAGLHLWWVDPPPGSVLELRAPVEKAGRYRITLGLTKSWDYGIHQPMVNGKDVGEPLDLCAPAITPLKVELGGFELKAGEALIGLRCVGTSPKAKPVRHMAGIDYILLKPVR